MSETTYEPVVETRYQRAARRHLAQAGTIPTFTMEWIWDMSVARASAKENGVSLTAVLIKALGVSAQEHVRVRSFVSENEVRAQRHPHIAVAVNTDLGLVVPVVRNADMKSLEKIGQDLAMLQDKATSGTLGMADITGGCLTVSNMGMLGVKRFSATINPPQSCILAVGSMSDKSKITVTATADHRVLDGAEVARFLAAVDAHLASSGDLT